MIADLKTLESAAIRTQQAAGRAWADLQTCPRADMLAELQANYDMAVRMQNDAYAAWEAVTMPAKEADAFSKAQADYEASGFGYDPRA